METRIIIRPHERMILVEHVLDLAEYQKRTGIRRPSLEEVLTTIQRDRTEYTSFQTTIIQQGGN